jgi:hypothetical protein
MATYPRETWGCSPVAAKAAEAHAPRCGEVQLRAEQESWLHDLIADAIHEGDLLRPALDRLRADKAGWSELREAVLEETQARAGRR